VSEEGPSYEEIVARARAAAAAKRASGEVPEGTSAALDRLFLEVAPGGARPRDGAGEDALGQVVEMLGRYRFDPSIPIGGAPGPGMRGRVAGLVKRAVQPLATWQLRHLTDQLNAYHLAETELLRSLVEERRAEPPGSGPPDAPATGPPAAPAAVPPAAPAVPPAAPAVPPAAPAAPAAGPAVR
jgi:hypothetical protein